MAAQPLDMRMGSEAALARVVSVFGAAHPHHAYVFANRRANRMKALVHDGIGVWLVARRLNAGRFVWTSQGSVNLQLSRTQLDALVLGLPSQAHEDARQTLDQRDCEDDEAVAQHDQEVAQGARRR